jgi:hypothetical protein
MAAARVIFLWLRCQHLFARLARQTSRQLQHEAALARMQHKQECCAHALQAEEQRQQAAAARAKAIADEATTRHRQAEAAIGEQRRQAATAQGKALAQATAERRCREATAVSAELDLAKVQCLEDALAPEIHRRESAKRAAEMAENALAAEIHCHESAERAVETAEKTLADKANEQRRATAREKALADEALAEDEYDKDNDYVARRIDAFATPFFACVDAVMAEIRAMDNGFGNWAAFDDELLIEEEDEASAPTMPPSAPPTAMSSPHHHPKSYVDAVLTTMGGSSQATSHPLAQATLPSPAIDGKL